MTQQVEKVAIFDKPAYLVSEAAYILHPQCAPRHG